MTTDSADQGRKTATLLVAGLFRSKLGSCLRDTVTNGHAKFLLACDTILVQLVDRLFLRELVQEFCKRRCLDPPELLVAPLCNQLVTDDAHVFGSCASLHLRSDIGVFRVGVSFLLQNLQQSGFE